MVTLFLFRKSKVFLFLLGGDIRNMSGTIHTLGWKCPFSFSYRIIPASGCRLTCRESTTFTIASIGLVLGRFVCPHFRLCFWGTVDYHCFVGAKVQRLNSVVFSTAGGKHGPDLHKQSLELTNSHWNSSIIQFLIFINIMEYINISHEPRL